MGAEPDRKAQQDAYDKKANKDAMDFQRGIQGTHTGSSSNQQGLNTKNAGSCFTFSTRVLTLRGWQEIGTVKVGDSVLSYDQASGKLNAREVTKKLEHSPTTIWKVCGSRSQPVLTTSHHPFLTQRGWVLTKNLNVGDKLLTVGENNNNEFDPVSFVGTTGQLEPVYNLHTATEHTFIASGYVVHNFAYFRALRTWWHQNFIDPKESAKSSLIDPVFS
jgi:hypothetical protein